MNVDGTAVTAAIAIAISVDDVNRTIYHGRNKKKTNVIHTIGKRDN